jgi:hypothetical protein
VCSSDLDQVILAVAGERAQFVKRYGVESLTEEDLTTECALRVNVGIGAVDPMQSIAKFDAAITILGKVAPFLDRRVRVNAEEIIREVMGKAGWKDGMRFFVMDEPGQEQEQPSPEEIKERAETERTLMETQSREKIASENNETKLRLAKIEGQQDLLREIVDKMANRMAQDRDIGARERQSSRQIAASGQREKRRDAISLLSKGIDVKERAADRTARQKQRQPQSAE